MNEWILIAGDQQLMAALRTDVLAQSFAVGQPFKFVAETKTRQDVPDVRIRPIGCQPMPQARATVLSGCFVADQGAHDACSRRRAFDAQTACRGPHSMPPICIQL
jgi:hypothetical protein